MEVRRNDHERVRELLSAYVDGELGTEDRRTVEDHLSGCPECRKEFEEMARFERVMGKMTFKSPPREVWELYWVSVYNRLERRVGWVFLSLGAIVLIFYGGYRALAGLLHDPAVPLLIKGGVLLALAGGAILLVSVLRERLFVRKRERYKEIEI
jgi:predicted anti-sigma-YlaC factor YlaD